MNDENNQTGVPIDFGAVSCALRTELAERGYQSSSDTTGMHRALYIIGLGDRARALFEFKPSADDAVYDLVYQGAWVAGMPPRFVVLPREEASSPSLDTLEQMKAIPLLFDVGEDTITFRDLDRMQELIDAD
ncbi:MAG: hypothetical protein HGA39_07170 [Coriobacteriia bacterium]|nr:hypothetical protein [Coriobacteriia bacterium]